MNLNPFAWLCTACSRTAHCVRCTASYGRSRYSEAVESDRRLYRVGLASVVVTLLLATVPAGALAQPEAAAQRFDAANDRYRAGAYDEAAALYEALVDDGYASVALFHNLGNTYVRLDEPGQAVRYYEKARALGPDNAAVLHNLEIVRSRLPDQISQLPEPFWRPWWKALVRTAGAGGLFALGLAAYLAGLGLVAHRLWTKTRSPWHRRARWTTLLSGTLLLGLAFLASADPILDRRAVVVADQAALREAPAADAAEARVLHEGVVLQVLASDGTWASVRLPNGQTGWITADAVADV